MTIRNYLIEPVTAIHRSVSADFRNYRRLPALHTAAGSDPM